MARMIVALIFARSKRGATCPKCNGTNTVAPDGDLCHCFDCGHNWRLE